VQVGAATNTYHCLSNTKTIDKNGYIYVHGSNESKTGIDVFLDDLNITHTKGKVLQEDHYYPFGLGIAALSSTAPLSKPNRYKFNGGTEFNSDFSLNWYETTHRGLDVTLGRFMQIDLMADILSSINPYNFGYNNPIMFNDPSGLMGQGCPTGDCDEDYYNDGEVRDLGEVVVTAPRSGSTNSSFLSFDSFLNEMKWSGNSVKRGLWAQYNQNGVQGLSNVLSQPKSLHFSQAEYLFSKNNQYMKDLGKLYAYGVSGTMLAVVAGPMFLEIGIESGLISMPSFSSTSISAKGFVGKATFDLGLQFIGNSIAAGRLDASGIDAFDVAVSGFGLNMFMDAGLKSLIDITPLQSNPLSGPGFGKSGNDTVLDFGFGIGGDLISTNMPPTGASGSNIVPATIFKLVINLANTQFKRQNDK
jgi:RHS repeat-associated protein